MKLLIIIILLFCYSYCILQIDLSELSYICNDFNVIVNGSVNYKSCTGYENTQVRCLFTNKYWVTNSDFDINYTNVFNLDCNGNMIYDKLDNQNMNYYVCGYSINGTYTYTYMNLSFFFIKYSPILMIFDIVCVSFCSMWIILYCLHHLIKKIFQCRKNDRIDEENQINQINNGIYIPPTIVEGYGTDNLEYEITHLTFKENNYDLSNI